MTAAPSFAVPVQPLTPVKCVESGLPVYEQVPLDAGDRELAGRLEAVGRHDDERRAERLVAPLTFVDVASVTVTLSLRRRCSR